MLLCLILLLLTSTFFSLRITTPGLSPLLVPPALPVLPPVSLTPWIVIPVSGAHLPPSLYLTLLYQRCTPDSAPTSLSSTPVRNPPRPLVSYSLQVAFRIMGKSLACCSFNVQLSPTSLFTSSYFISARIALKYPSYVLHAPAAPTVQEQCGASVNSAAPSPWSTPINPASFDSPSHCSLYLCFPLLH